MRHIALAAALLSGCAGTLSNMDRAHEALQRGQSAYHALCTPTPVDAQVCGDLREALNAGVDLWNALPEDDE